MERHAVTTHAFAAAPGATCGQELATTDFVARGGSKWGESVSVTLCSPHALEGVIDVYADGRQEVGPTTTSMAFGDDPDNQRCLASEATIADARDSSSSGTAAGGAASGGATGAASSTHATAAPVLQEISGDAECPNDYSYYSYAIELGRLEAKSNIRVRIWSELPNDIAGAIVKISHNIDQPNVSDEEWAAHVAEEDRKWQAEYEKQQQQRTAARPPRKQPVGPTSPPPPPRAETTPPRPSHNAEWIPGYWLFASGEWVWLGGRWDIPEGDVAAGLTVRAPRLPPGAKVEVSPAAILGVVWQAGYWAWDGAAFVWVEGQWQKPPAGHPTWQPATWRIDASGKAVFVPGRWVPR